jgi:hypothetical protein
VERRPGGVAEPVRDPFEVLGAKPGVGGDLLDREALGGAQPLDGAASLGAVGGGASVVAPAGLGFDGRWFALQAEVDGEDLADALDADADMPCGFPERAALNNAQPEDLEIVPCYGFSCDEDRVV